MIALIVLFLMIPFVFASIGPLLVADKMSTGDPSRSFTPSRAEEYMPVLWENS